MLHEYSFSIKYFITHRDYFDLVQKLEIKVKLEKATLYTIMTQEI